MPLTQISTAAEANARSILERALRSKPSHIPVLEAYCRFLNTTNQFVESLVACARTLSFDPWNGLVRFNLGLAGISEDLGISIVDVDSILARAGADRLKIDAMHLTPEGYQLVAEEVARILVDLDVMPTMQEQKCEPA